MQVITDAVLQDGNGLVQLEGNATKRSLTEAEYLISTSRWPRTGRKVLVWTSMLLALCSKLWEEFPFVPLEEINNNFGGRSNLYSLGQRQNNNRCQWLSCRVNCAEENKPRFTPHMIYMKPITQCSFQGMTQQRKLQKTKTWLSVIHSLWKLNTEGAIEPTKLKRMRRALALRRH